MRACQHYANYSKPGRLELLHNTRNQTHFSQIPLGEPIAMRQGAASHLETEAA